jgi:hypothetical protein
MSQNLVDDDEIERMTRPLKQGFARAKRLEKMLGCKIPRRPDGFPVVTRDMLARLQDKEKPVDAGIRWTK